MPNQFIEERIFEQVNRFKNEFNYIFGDILPFDNGLKINLLETSFISSLRKIAELQHEHDKQMMVEAIEKRRKTVVSNGQRSGLDIAKEIINSL